jgi:hypothetical protein
MACHPSRGVYLQWKRLKAIPQVDTVVATVKAEEVEGIP